ncbi:hypothetical protein Dsin_003166 [Dipteronia sinensis]|uniref:Transposase MuDR plant domain-containing protein n=1 Tax=Dipteronia sinensis TaxID=43782 RepID=A0AAE0B8H7_9ROSI|nr:hypothetical protein Dsin_003166 [Dipteronia sinensis]
MLYMISFTFDQKAERLLGWRVELVCGVESQVDDYLEPNYDHVRDQGRRAHGDHPCGRYAGDMQCPKNVNLLASDTQSTWVIPGSEAYTFGQVNNTMRSCEPNTSIYKGQFFQKKNHLKRSIGLHAMMWNFEWKVKMSNKSVTYLVCKINNCKWELRAVRRDEGIFFQVRSFEIEHNCPLEEVHRCHRQANAVIIGEVSP